MSNHQASTTEPSHTLAAAFTPEPLPEISATNSSTMNDAGTSEGAQVEESDLMKAARKIGMPSPSSSGFNQWWLKLARSGLNTRKSRRFGRLESKGISDDPALRALKGVAKAIRESADPPLRSEAESRQLRSAADYLESTEQCWNAIEQQYQTEIMYKLDRSSEQLKDGIDVESIQRIAHDLSDSLEATSAGICHHMYKHFDEWWLNEDLLAAQKLLDSEVLEDVNLGIQILVTLMRWVFMCPDSVRKDRVEQKNEIGDNKMTNGTSTSGCQ